MRLKYIISLIVIFTFLVSLILIYAFTFNIILEVVLASMGILTWTLIVTAVFIEVESRQLDVQVNGGEDTSAQQENQQENEADHFELRYEQLNAEIRSRDNLTIIAGSIMTTASLVLLGILFEIKPDQEISIWIKILLSTVIVLIFSVWFLGFNLTSRLLNRLEWELLRRLEREPFRLHSVVFDQIKNQAWWKYGRRPVWLYFYYILATACILILLG